MGRYRTINPKSGEAIADFPELTDAEAADAVARAHAQYASWRRTPVAERAAILARAGELFRDRAEELANLLVLEIGKPLAQARGEVDLSARIFDYYAENAEAFMTDEPIDVRGPGSAAVSTEPLGVIIGVMPWNYPYYQVARFAAPNLALGNTVLLKHARNCPQSALAIERLLHDAGLPADAYINAFATSSQIADMIADPRVQGVSLTGSERAGAAVGEVAGRHMKKYVLELGGSDALIVLDDADLDAAAAAAASGRFTNAGQACTASKRMIALASVYDEFLEKYTAAAARWQTGDPADENTRLGPLASDSARDEIHALVDDAVGKGAQVHLGGSDPEATGAYYPATVLSGVTPDMRAYGEELFGPVGVVYRVDDEADAIRLANDSPYGLSASVFTGDVERGKRIASQLETGMVWINGVSRSSPELPFGGVKASGVGRELGRYGFNEFANKKLIRIL